nr:uncharacterized protein LOC112795044 [Arachis hypogaea]
MIPTEDDHTVKWTLYVNGSSNTQGCGAGIWLEGDDGFILEHSLHLTFKASNNQSEYEVLIAGLRLCLDLHISAIKEQDWQSSFIHYLQTGEITDSVENAKSICRFGILRHIITDNDRQFVDKKFTTFLETLKIKHHFASIEHPQTNEVAEVANKVTLHALKKKLDDAKGLWAEFIPEILWGYNTTTQSSTKETPFRLVYGSKVMIPLEILQSSIRTQVTDHDEARQAELDVIEEIKDIATLRLRAAQQAIARRHNKSVKSRSFQKGYLVLRKTESARKPLAHGKLAANWDDPYRITEVLDNGAYKLESINGTTLPNTWNVSSLKKFYS